MIVDIVSRPDSGTTHHPPERSRYKEEVGVGLSWITTHLFFFFFFFFAIRDRHLRRCFSWTRVPWLWFARRVSRLASLVVGRRHRRSIAPPSRRGCVAFHRTTSFLVSISVWRGASARWEGDGRKPVSVAASGAETEAWSSSSTRG